MKGGLNKKRGILGIGRTKQLKKCWINFEKKRNGIKEGYVRMKGNKEKRV